MFVKPIGFPLVKRFSALCNNKMFTAVLTGAHFPGVKRPRCKADHSTPPSAQVKKVGAILPLSQHVLTLCWTILHLAFFTGGRD